MATMTEAAANFAMNFLTKLEADGKDAFFSPASIVMTMSIVYAGSSGATKEQMKNVLFNNIDDEHAHEWSQNLNELLNRKDEKKEIELESANRVYCRMGEEILQPYRDLLVRYYNTDNNLVQSVDFATKGEEVRNEINKWVSDRTRGKIPVVIADAFGKSTRMMIVNALYFKGGWLEEFEKSETKKRPFYTSEEKTVDIEMMTQINSFPFFETDEYKALAMYYRSHTMKMVFVLPNEKEGLTRLEKELTGTKLMKICRSMQIPENTVRARIPKMKLDKDYMLNEPLKRLGIVDAFEYPAADFSLIDGTRGLFLSKVFHKAFVQVDERGTEAAGATSAEVVDGGCSTPKRQLEFIADHPFLFATTTIRSCSSATSTHRPNK